MSEYVVLRKHNDGAWEEVSRADVASEQAAIRATVNGSGGGTYVAVPVRSFRPRTVTVEQVEKVRLS